MDPRTLHAACILAVDDEQANLDLLRHLLLRDGFVDVRGTTSPREALALFHSLRPDLVVLDLHMPEMGGMELLGALAPTLAERGFLPVLVVSGDLSQPARQQALARGAKDFLAKPYDPGEALLRIRNLLEMRFLHQEVLRHNDELERRVAERTAELEIAHQEVIDRLGRAAEFRDDDTGEHTRRVGVLSGRIAARLGGMGPAWVRRLTRAAALHDVGKIAVPDAILRKPGPLTDDERTVMRTHALLGAQLLSGGRSETLQMAERIAAAHHERWDGAGYPLGLAADQIPLEARIVAVADFFDALSYARPYRGPVPPAEVLKMITDGAGTHFDPEVVAAFLELAVASAPPP